MNRLRIGIGVCLMLLVSSCSSTGKAPLETTRSHNPAVPAAQPAWLAELPRDGVQPWEQTDANGFVIPGSRSGSVINAGSEFAAGVERFGEGSSGSGSVTEMGEALRLASGAAGAGGKAYATYRLPVGGAEPGAFSFDVNMVDDGSSGSFWVGLADYGSQRWQWLGPYAENNVRLGGDMFPAGDYSSELGNAFISLLVFDGASIDVVGVSLNPDDAQDNTAPPVPTGLTLSGVDSGLEAQWNSVIASDLAGYRVYYSSSSFASPAEPGVRSLPSLQSLTRALVFNSAGGELFVAVSALDISGNESGLSAVQQATVGSTIPQPALTVSVDQTSVMRDGVISLSCSPGLAAYELDLDGDGIYEDSNADGSGLVNTSAPGLIRVNVRASDGSAVAHGGISVIVLANTRPSCTATASNYSPALSQLVSFTGTAQDAEDTEAELDFSWDMDGDGLFEVASTNPHEASFGNLGYSQVKLIVTDTQGAWDVDSIAVNVIDNSPTAVLKVSSDNVQVGEPVLLDARDSYDLDGSITAFDYDLDGDGDFDTMGAGALEEVEFDTSGLIEVGLRVVDDQFNESFDTAFIEVQGWGNSKVALDAPSGRHCSMAEVDGELGVVYYNESSDSLEFTRSDGPLPNPWSAPVQIDGMMGGSLGYCSLAVVSGMPAVAYHHHSSGSLRFARAQDAQGTAWNGPQTLDSGAMQDQGHWPCLVVVNGNPAVCYQDADTGDLLYNRSNDAVGMSWNGMPTVVDPDGTTGAWTSMAVVNGNPAIAYCQSSTNDLDYIRALDTTGNSWPADPVIVDGLASGLEPRVSMAVISGFPAVAWESGTNLHYRRATDVDGVMWGSSQQLDNGGALSSMVEENGLPQVAYYHDFDNTLRVIGGIDPLFSSRAFTRIEVIGQLSLADQDSISLKLVNGQLAVAFHDGDQNRLMYNQFVP